MDTSVYKTQGFKICYFYMFIVHCIVYKLYYYFIIKSTYLVYVVRIFYCESEVLISYYFMYRDLSNKVIDKFLMTNTHLVTLNKIMHFSYN